METFEIREQPPPGEKLRLGEYLVQQGILSEDRLRDALREQQRTGGQLGRILLALGYVHRLDLYRALSDLWDFPFVLLTEVELDEELIQTLTMEEALEHSVIPLRQQAGRLDVAITERPHAEVEALLKDRFGVDEVQYHITTDWDFDRAARRIFEHDLMEGSVYKLFYRYPEESAFTVFTQAQYVGLAGAGLLLIGGLYAALHPTLVGLNVVVNLLFFVAVAFKFFVSLAGAHLEDEAGITDAEVRALDDEALPMYTILVPVYKEANVIGGLMEHLGGLDYPKHKLEILVLIEEDDEETLAAAQAAAPPHNVEFVIIPTRQPKTKPKACNVGMYFAQGDLVVIYDAEDRPEADQLKKAVIAFAQGDDDLICVQAALNYYNAGENVLTRMFTLEYSFWFDYMLPGLQRLGLPIPLGGTSNHFRADRLRELGNWDPFNVTEDADLGIRAAMHGYRVGTINSTTFEEANNAVWNWIRQRSRWIKGYMQTMLVHARHPIELLRRVGLKQALGFALLIGGTPLVFLLTPLLFSIMGLWLVVGAQPLEPYFPPVVLYLSLFNVTWGNALAIYLNMLAVFQRRYFGLVPFALLNPFYWWLHAYASFKALGQLFSKPFFWEKTNHGLTDHTTASA